MPRNGSGTSSVINTFVIDTIADPDEVNANFTDIADQLTDSLPRDGQAGMNAPLPLQNGTAALPALTFTSDPDTGIYRSSANKLGISANGAASAVFAENGIEDTTTICDPSDGTKKARFDAGGITAGNTRVITLPDADVTLSGVPRGHIFGLTLTNNATDATNDIDIAAGEAASDASTPWMMTLASAITKRLDAGWSVGTNQGGLDTGTVGNNTYYIWLIQRSDTGVTDVCLSASSSGPATGGANPIPAAYDRKRCIGDVTRAGGVNGVPRSYSARVTRTVIVGGTTAVSGTYIPRPGCTEIRAQLQAAGGGGGYGRSTAGNAAVGGGGGSGQWAEKTIFSPAASYAYSLGANGKGGIAASSTAATDGGTSTFGSPAILTCVGGSGANSSSPTATTGGSAGGGAGGTGATGGDIQVDGVRGDYGVVFSASIAFSGAGADSKLGVGPNGADASSGPLSGAGYGSGGSGGVRTNGAQSDGGAGGLAILIIDEFG